MTISIQFDGHDIQARVPTLADLSKLREGLSGKRDSIAEAFKQFAKACIITPPFRDILKAKPAAGFTLGKTILEACGGKAEPYVLEEDELDEQVAAAMVAAETKGFQGLTPIVIGHKEEAHVLILRAAKEREIDAYFKTESAEAAQTLVKACAVFPDPVDFDRTTPGLYLGLANFIVEQAGFRDEAALGE